MGEDTEMTAFSGRAALAYAEGMGTGVIVVSPVQLAWLLFWSFVCGMFLGVFYDVLRISRVFMGIRYAGKGAQALYERELPVLKKYVSPPTSRAGIFLQTAIFLQDILFGVVCGITLILVLFFCVDGQFRAMAPLGMLLGFIVYYKTLGSLVLRFSQMVAFFLRAFFMYLCALLLLPFRLLLWLWRKTFGRLAGCLFGIVRRAVGKRTDRKIWDSLAGAAACGWLESEIKKKRRIKERGKRDERGQDKYSRRAGRTQGDGSVARDENISGVDSRDRHAFLRHKADGVQQVGAGKRDA